MALSGGNDRPAATLPENARVSLDIRVRDAQGNERSLSLQSRVEEVRENGSFLIQMPTHRGNYYSLPRDERITMYFVGGKSQAGDIPEMFAAPVSFVERVVRGNIVFAEMEIIGEIEPSQRRDCYRLWLSRPVTLKRQENGKVRESGARMVNFSDGGMLVATDEDLAVNERVSVDFELDEPETVDCLVRRVEELENADTRFRAALRFESVSAKQKQQFYRYIMEKQLEKRRRIR